MLLCRSKDQFFRSEADLNAAKDELVALIEAERDQEDPTLEERVDHPVEEDAEDESSVSVVHHIKKKIRLEKKRQQQVWLVLIFYLGTKLISTSAKKQSPKAYL